MKTSGKRFATAILVIAALTIAAIWRLGYHTSAFKGGVDFRDSGLFSYPRYHAQLGVLPLWQDGEHRFDVWVLPPGPLDLELNVEDATGADRAELTSLSTSVSASIFEVPGTKICSETGCFLTQKPGHFPHGFSPQVIPAPGSGKHPACNCRSAGRSLTRSK